MNARNLLQSSLIATLLAAGAAAQAAPMGEGDTLSGQPVQVQSVRTFSAAQSASLATASRSGERYYDEGYGAGVTPLAANSHLDRAVVEQAAIRAERAGKIESGDAISF
jgi:hypothetical protein